MNTTEIFSVLKEPKISEKSTIGESSNQYVFIVSKISNKKDIKEAVETIFNVKVISVNTSCQRGKKKTFGKILGKRKDYKKAYVRLAQGNTINFIPE